MNTIDWLKNYLGDVTRGLERFCNRYYGTYPARVIDNSDPEERGRVRATCPAINMPDPEDVPGGFWMMPCMNGLGTTPDGQITGIFHPPNEGTNIWVTFEFGDPRCPIYMGGWVTTKQTATTFNSDDMENKGPHRRGIRTASGHYILLNDDPDNLEITISKGDGEGEPTAQFISMTKEGHTLMTNSKGSNLYLNAADDETTLQTVDVNGNVKSYVFLGPDKVTLMTESGAMLGMDGKDILLNGDNIILNGAKQVYLKSGKVLLGDGASEPAMKGRSFSLGYGLIHQHTSATPGAPTTPGTTPPVLPNKELSSKVFIS